MVDIFAIKAEPSFLFFLFHCYSEFVFGFLIFVMKLVNYLESLNFLVKLCRRCKWICVCLIFQLLCFLTKVSWKIYELM
jgi:hypothetical protein